MRVQLSSGQRCVRARRGVLARAPMTPPPPPPPPRASLLSPSCCVGAHDPHPASLLPPSCCVCGNTPSSAILRGREHFGSRIRSRMAHTLALRLRRSMLPLWARPVSLAPHHSDLAIWLWLITVAS